MNSRWRLQVASSFRRKTRRLPDDIVLRREETTRPQRPEGGNGQGNRDRNGDRNGHEEMNGGGNGGGNGSGHGSGNGSKGGVEREPRNLRCDRRGGSDDATEGVTPTSN